MAVVVCAMLLVLGSFPGQAVAQDRSYRPSTLVKAPAGLAEVAALFKRANAPVRLYELRGPDSVAVGEAARFAAVANIGTAALPLRVRWDFGDGTTASSLHALHRYEVPGTYTVTFTIANDEGEASGTLEVTAHAVSHPPGDAGDLDSQTNPNAMN